MAIGIILGIVLFLAFVGCGIWAIISFADCETERGIIATVLTIVALIAFIIVPFSFHTINTGEVAVVKHLGQAKEVRTAGTYYDFWMTKKYQKYDTKVRKMDIETATYSSDAQTMNVQMTLQYQIMSDKVMDIVKQYGSLEVLETRINSIAIEKTKAVLSSHKAMNIIANRAAMSPEVEEAVKSAIGKEYFINVTAVVLTNIDFSDAFELAVEEKMIAEQKQLKAEYENQTKVAQAEADAEAKIIAAEADKKANELLEKSITDKILEKEWIDKWDGKLPQVVAGDETGIMIPSLGE